MKIEVKGSDGQLTATLSESDDFKSFAVHLDPTTVVRSGDRTADGAVTFTDPEEAWVDQAWLRRVGGFDEDESRAISLGKMLDYAAQKGWIDGETGAIQAHVERST